LGGGHAITISGGSGGKYTGHDPEGYAINTNYGGLTTYKPPYAQGRYTGKWFGSAYTSSGGDADMYIPRGLRIENATEAEIEIARSMQFEKDFENGDYQSDLDVARGMTNCNQKCSNWCWATSATMAASAFGGGSKCVTEEEKVAGHEFHTSCDGSCSSKCNQGGTTGEIADGIKFLSGHSYSSGGALSQKRLDSALRHGPVVIGVQWTLGGGHAITISGGSGGKYTGHDPEGYAIDTNYGGLTTYKPPYAQGRYTGKWFGSAYTSSGESLTASSENTILV
jgi:hypothetical protein